MNFNATKRYKEIDLPFTCPVTNRIFNSGKGLSIYLTKTLKVEHDEYYDKYINHRDSNCFFCGNRGEFISVSKGYRNLCSSEQCLKKSFSSYSVEGIMYRYNCSRKEAEIIFEKERKKMSDNLIIAQQILRKKDPLWDKKRSRNCKEFWIKKGYSEEESILKSKEVMKEIHYKTFKKFKENPKKYASKQPTKIEYYLKMGYSDEDAKNLLSERQKTFSLDICIQKHGKEKGRKIWEDRQKKWLDNLNSKSEEEKIEINRKKLFNNSGYSKISQNLFWSIYEFYKKNNIKFEELNSEVIRYDKKNKKHYRYDYVDFTLKKCIEFNGDYWHCNPSKYNENYIHTIMNKSAKEIWDNDEKKIRWMNEHSYQVLTIWESEYRKNPEQTLEKCLNFLNN
jgi:G:T-mismatch repair DNA endonuclease (very short patch repair protein)